MSGCLTNIYLILIIYNHFFHVSILHKINSGNMSIEKFVCNSSHITARLQTRHINYNNWLGCSANFEYLNIPEIAHFIVSIQYGNWRRTHLRTTTSSHRYIKTTLDVKPLSRKCLILQVIQFLPSLLSEKKDSCLGSRCKCGWTHRVWLAYCERLLCLSQSSLSMRRSHTSVSKRVLTIEIVISLITG